MKMSPAQRKYYFGVLVRDASRYYKGNIGNLIRDVLIAVEAEPSEAFVHELFKMMFNNGRSTQILEQKIKDVEVEDDATEIYFLKIRAHHDVHGNRMPLPNEIPDEACGD
jgi:hypothetical protein